MPHASAHAPRPRLRPSPYAYAYTDREVAGVTHEQVLAGVDETPVAHGEYTGSGVFLLLSEPLWHAVGMGEGWVDGAWRVGLAGEGEGEGGSWGLGLSGWAGEKGLGEASSSG